MMLLRGKIEMMQMDLVMGGQERNEDQGTDHSPCLDIKAIAPGAVVA
jgi:hypothetical protein